MLKHLAYLLETQVKAWETFKKLGKFLKIKLIFLILIFIKILRLNCSFDKCRLKAMNWPDSIWGGQRFTAVLWAGPIWVAKPNRGGGDCPTCPMLATALGLFLALCNIFLVSGGTFPFPHPATPLDIGILTNFICTYLKVKSKVL